MFGDGSWCDPYKTWLVGSHHYLFNTTRSHPNFFFFFKDVYNTDPLANVTQQVYKDRIRGGEACMWSELVGAESVMSKVWPRAAAYGGRLWNYYDVQSPMWVCYKHCCDPLSIFYLFVYLFIFFSHQLQRRHPEPRRTLAAAAVPRYWLIDDCHILLRVESWNVLLRKGERKFDWDRNKKTCSHPNLTPDWCACKNVCMRACPSNTAFRVHFRQIIMLLWC